MEKDRKFSWLLFFYSVPATPVNNRVKVWRKLQKAGAVQLKGGVYILPAKEEHHEALQWLLAELPGIKGEGLLVKTDTIEPLHHQDIVALFNEQRHPQYLDIAKKIDEFSGRLRNLRKGGSDKKATSLFKHYEKILSEFQAIQHRDFFQSAMGREVAAQIGALRKQLEELTAVEKGQRGPSPLGLANVRGISNFSGLTWLTRKRPYVDRMASAWLIRRFIDPKAAFAFKDEIELKDLTSALEVSFDVRKGDFTHIDDLCTFEVLVKSFNLADKGLESLSRIVHDIDIKDGKFAASEAHVVEMIIKGIRTQALADSETLEQGIAVFEALYLSMTEQH